MDMYGRVCVRSVFEYITVRVYSDQSPRRLVARGTTPAKPLHPPTPAQAASSPPPPPTSSGFSVLFCRLYFIATSGVCLFRSGTVGFQKKLQIAKKTRFR